MVSVRAEEDAPVAVVHAQEDEAAAAVTYIIQTVRVGDQRTITLDFPLGEVTADGEGQFVRVVQVDGAEAISRFELRVEGVAVGRETLLLRDATGAVRRGVVNIVVEPAALERCAEQVRVRLAAFPEVAVTVQYTRVLVRGLALSDKARGRAYHALDASPPPVGDCPLLAVLEQTAEAEAALTHAVNDELRAMHIRTVAASVREHRLILQGAVRTEDELERSQLIAVGYDPTVVNMVVIRPPMSRKEAAVAARRALKSAGYDLFAVAKDGRITIEGAVESMADRAAVETLVRASVGPHADAIVLRVVIR